MATGSRRSRANDGLKNRPESFPLTRFGPAWRLARRVGPLGRWLNRTLIDRAISRTETRPHPFSTMGPYASRGSLTDRTWSGCHPPPVPPAAAGRGGRGIRRPPAGGVIRVVLVDEPTGWRAYFCTDPSASVADMLMTVEDRFSLEITFRGCKEIVGAGQQQVRFIWASIGAFHICLWTYTLTEAWAWSRSADELVDRPASPWDVASRRPSHADKRRAWRRELLDEEIRAVVRPGATEAEIQATAERLLSLAASH